MLQEEFDTNKNAGENVVEKPAQGEVQIMSRLAALPAEDVILGTKPTPPLLKYALSAVLAVAVLGIVAFGIIHQSSIKPPASSGDCSDPVTANQLRETLKTNPNDFQTLMQYGSYSYECSKDYASAISAYSQAAVVADSTVNKVSDQDRLQAHMSLGLAYLNQTNSNPDKALQQFQLILAAQPTNPNALFGMGAATYALNPNQPDKAIAYWQKVIDQDPTSDAAQKAQQLIQAIQAKDQTTNTPAAK